MSTLQRTGNSLTGPIAVSALLHAMLIASFVTLRSAPPKMLPPMYKVDLIAAAPGPRAVGVVKEVPAPRAAEVSPPKPTVPSVPKVPLLKASDRAKTRSVPVKATR